MQFLNELRTKSPHVKAYYGLGFASAITGIIALVWMSTIPAQFSRQAQIDTDEETPGIMDTFLQEGGEQLANVIETIPDGSVSEPTEGTNEIIPENSVSAGLENISPEPLSPDSALGRLTGETDVSSPQMAQGGQFTNSLNESVELPKPATSSLPIATITESDPVAQENTQTAPIPENTKPKPVLIEVKPVSKKPILIGTSTVQKTE